MAKYLDKWKDLFPDTVGGTTRPSEAVSDQEEFNTNGFPQFIAQDPVNYALQNAFLKQFLSNDAWLWVKQQQANQALDKHKGDAQAHPNGISGNAASATKLRTPRALNLSGAVTADAATFDGTVNATINVKTLDATKLKGTASVSTTGNAATASKLSTARKINITGNATGAATFDGTSDVSINVSVSQAAHADKATQDTNGRAFTDTNAYMHISALADGTDFNDVRTTGIYYCTGETYPNRPHNTWGILTVYHITTIKQEYRPDNEAVYYARKSNDGQSWTAWSKVNAANADTATKLATPRTISLTGNASGSAAFDGSGDISISTTVNESKHAATATTVNATAPNGGAADLAFGTMAVNDYARIRVYGEDDNGALEIATADSGNEPIYARQYSGAFDWPNGRPGTVTNEAAILDSNGNTKFPKNVTAASFTGPLKGNSATATKLATARTISLTGKAAGSATFDGSANASINVTSVNADTASKLSTARKINITGNASGSAAFDGSGNVSINTTVSQAANADVVHKAIQPRGVFGHNSYIFYGTLTIPQNGDFFKLEVLGGSGFNADIGQSLEGTLYFRTGNGNPANYAAYSEYHRNGAGNLKFFVVKDSGTRYRIYSGLTNYTGTMQVIPYVGENSSFDLALTTVSALPDGVVEVEQQRLIYASTVNNYAPTKTGGGASGTWGINITGNAATATKAGTCTGNAATATKLATPRAISLTGNASGSANFDGSGNVSINTTVSQAANADKVDGIHAASMFYSKGDWDADNWATMGAYEVSKSNNPPVSDAYGWGQVISSSTNGARFQLYATDYYGGNGRLHYRTGFNDRKNDWNTILDSENYNLFAPTKTGGGASGTWGINISGNAASATNADKLDGYHASDLLGKIYPVGSIYISVSGTNPASLFGIGTWVEVGQGRTLWGADSSHAAGSTIEAGLPNITGTLDANTNDGTKWKTGAFYDTGSGVNGADGDGWGGTVAFDASRSNAIYGKSSTVQPPALVVHFWKRTA